MKHSPFRDLRQGSVKLALTSLIFRALAVVVLAPVLCLVTRIFLEISGHKILADTDILSIATHPLGWAALFVLGTLSLIFLAMDLGSLITVRLVSQHGHSPAGVRIAVRFVLGRFFPLLGLTARAAAALLLLVALFLLALGASYSLVLGQYDINWYLADKPAAYWTAVVMAGVLALVLGAALVLLFSRYYQALPLVLYEDTPPGEALRLSATRTRGHWRGIAVWVAGWALISTLVLWLVSAALEMAGDYLSPIVADNLTEMFVALAALAAVFAVLHLLISIAQSISLASILAHFYREYSDEGGTAAADATFDKLASQEPHTVVSRLALTTCILVAILVALFSSEALLDDEPARDKTEIIAHRGASTDAPENTLAAVRAAIEAKADRVEIDVQHTKDGEVVVIHDADLMRVGKLPLKIADTPYNVLAEVDIGSWFAPEFADERLPTLDQVLGICKDKIDVTIELKYYGKDKELAPHVIEIVEAHGMADQITLMSLKQSAVTQAHELRPAWTIGLLNAVAIGDLTLAGADFLAVSSKSATRDFVQSSHQRDSLVHSWTINKANMMWNMMSRGVDGIITDEPALALSVLDTRDELSPTDRLIISRALHFGLKVENRPPPAQ